MPFLIVTYMFSELHLRNLEISNCRGDACIALVLVLFDDPGRGVPRPNSRLTPFTECLHSNNAEGFVRAKI